MPTGFPPARVQMAAQALGPAGVPHWPGGQFPGSAVQPESPTHQDPCGRRPSTSAPGQEAAWSRDVHQRRGNCEGVRRFVTSGPERKPASRGQGCAIQPLLRFNRRRPRSVYQLPLAREQGEHRSTRFDRWFDPPSEHGVS